MPKIAKSMFRVSKTAVLAYVTAYKKMQTAF